ncbi:ABC transporter substrate-binding protein [Marivirga sp. S37H4]|uniref:ABC transporter substrate-binding protein n=1 Tax=Marivirga aurantiaca TaxID=2802615 RepID=A0A934WY85_9BACT|nr:ABC transporter substrate-binding protein [Marivirga aurantiaca]MBK6264995.1 ABC transporter substrate-binding protein [Marivirga aurantiaca]
MKTQQSFYALIVILLSFSCSTPKEEQEKNIGTELIRYSEKLSIQAYEDYTKVTVKHSKNEQDVFTYILYPKDKSQPSIKADLYIQTPINKIICFSTSHLTALDALDLEQHLIGFPDTKWIYDSSLRAKVKAGSLQDIGQKNGINIEKTLKLQPDLVMAYSTGSAYDNLEPIQQANIPAVVNVDYLESNPLGRAEWIKFTAVFFNKVEEADSIFKSIESSYQELKDLGQAQASKPTVMTGVMYGDTWYVPGGNSYGAQFITDAGGNYLWSENKESGSLELSYESVLSKAQNADFWIGVANFSSYSNLKNTDSRYAYFDAFKEKNIYSYVKRVHEAGGNDYLESGFLRPDLILQDCIKILHPDVLSDREFTYFQALQP